MEALKICVVSSDSFGGNGIRDLNNLKISLQYYITSILPADRKLSLKGHQSAMGCPQAEFVELCAECPAPTECDTTSKAIWQDLVYGEWPQELKSQMGMDDFLFDFVPDRQYLTEFWSFAFDLAGPTQISETPQNFVDDVDRSSESLLPDCNGSRLMNVGSSTRSTKTTVSSRSRNSGSVSSGIHIPKNSRSKISEQSAEVKAKRRREQNKEAQRRSRHRTLQAYQLRASKWLQDTTDLLL